MPESQKPDDERIEELLSQLQGIFGKLSQTEEEESQKKEDIPRSGQPAPPAPLEPSAPEAPQLPPVAETPIIPMNPIEPAAEQTPAPEAPPVTVPMYVPPALGEHGQAPINPDTPGTPPLFDASQTPTAIFYPAGREAEARMLANRLETLTPRFTKITFALKVLCTAEYDPKAEWKGIVIQRAKEESIRALFVIVERPLDETRRKALAPTFDELQIYFQEVPFVSIEKRAFYTDLLLGMVFFFESLKAKGVDLGPTQ